VPKASERGSPHCDSAKAVGEGRPKVVRGRWRRRRYGATIHDLQPGDEDCRVKVLDRLGSTKMARKSDGTHLNDNRQKTYGALLHGQNSTKDRIATPALPHLPLLRPDICNGAKSGLTAYRWQVLMVAHWGAAGPATEIATRQRARWCQRHPNAAHPTTTPRRR